MLIHSPQPWKEVNQLLAHITNTPFSLIDYCKGQDILVEAYSPIAHGEALKNPAITDMAKKYGDSSFFPVFGGKM